MARGICALVVVLVALVPVTPVLTASLQVAEHAVRDNDVRENDVDRYRLPTDLLVGAGVSALQTEGAWDEGGKAESAVDHVILSGKLPGWNADHKVAADSYHHYKEDVAMAAKLKLKLYRFSISWSRVLPKADPTAPNLEGVAFYQNLINEIIKNDMTPMVTLCHFDHPQVLEDEFKGWQDRKMATKFAEYAKFAFETFGDRVKMWVTINEPNMYCAYFTALFVSAGFRTEAEVDAYQCIHNNILAHQLAYQAFKDGGHTGRVGYSTLLMHAKPATSNTEDVYAADAFNMMHAGISLNPVVYGDYPQEVKNIAGAKLPTFTDEEKRALKGSADFVGVNLYMGLNASYNRFRNSSADGISGIALGQLSKDLGFVDVTLGGTAGSSATSAFTTIDPDVMRSGLLWTWQTFNVPVVVTENGFGDVLGLGVHDTTRAAYHSAFLRALVSTVKDYGVKVLAYSAWSLIDSFEFTAGYKRPFGLVHVDYESGTRARTLKDSSSFWITMGDTKTVPFVPDPSATTTEPPATKKPSNAAPNATAASSLLTGLLLALCIRFM